MKTVKINKVIMHNYFKFADQTFCPPKDEVCLIVGNNEDIKGTDSNGAGKSGILSAISWGLTGQTIEEGQVLTYGQDECQVEIYLSIGIIIKRRIKNNGSWYLSLYTKQGLRPREEIHKSMTNTNKQDFIYNELGIEVSKDSYLDFINSIYFDPDGINIFVSPQKTPTEKLNYFSRHFKLRVYDASSKLSKGKADAFKDKSDILNNKIDNLIEIIAENTYIDLEDERVTTEEYVERGKTARKKTKVNITKLENKVESLKPDTDYTEKIIELQGKITTEKNNIYNIDNTIQEISITIDEHETKLIRIKKDIKSLSTERDKKLLTVSKDMCSTEEASQKIVDIILKNKELLNDIQDLNASIEGTTICPKCNSELIILDDRVNILDERTKANAVQTIADKGIQIQILSQKKEKYNTVIEINNIKDTIQQNINNKTDSATNVQQFNSILTKHSKTKNTYIKTLDDLSIELQKYKYLEEEQDNSIWEAAKTSLQDEKELLDNINVEIGKYEKTIEDSIANTSTLMKHQKNLKTTLIFYGHYIYWFNAFKKLKALVLDNSFVKLNQLTNRYLKQLEIPYTFEVKATGKFKSTDNIKLAINISVTDELGVVRNLYEYSKGERTRVINCMNIATKSINVNNMGFIFFDEYLNMLDETGEMFLLKMVQSLQQQALIVTNSASLQNNWHNTKVIVNRRNSVSTIQLQRR